MQKKKLKKYPAWYYLVLISIPVVLIIFLETVLYLSGYGNDYSTFVKISEEYKDYKFFNPKLPQKYFANSETTPSVIPDGFKVQKDNNTFRIFALGGSTTAGFPHPPNGSFPRLLKNKLQKDYPGKNFEVINLGISAINTVTIRDILEDVIDEDPNLIIMYAGHNEYYGALGPASKFSGFNFGSITPFVLEIKEFRTVQLIENLISMIVSLFSEKSSTNKTLMSEVAGRKLVPLNSNLFDAGVHQFSENLEYILEKCAARKIPVMIGNLVSNLKQQPLCKYVGCDSLASKFSHLIDYEELLNKTELIKIKEKDGLRFRAPEIFNQIILEKSNKYGSTFVDVKEVLENYSPKEIIGYNLMMDHLHPNFEGNNYIANTFFESIKNNEKLSENLNETNRTRTIVYPDYRTYTKLDSLYTQYRINYLLNDFPFAKRKSSINILPETEEQSLAMNILNGNMSWETAHIKLADYYFRKKEITKYIYEINTLIADKPFDKYPYLKAMGSLEKTNQSNILKYIYLKYFDVYPELSIAVKLGDLYFSQRNHREAIYYYEKCISVKDDAKIYFNLSASYYSQQEIKKAIDSIQKCLKLNPSYPNANKIYNSLVEVYNTQN